MFCVSNLCRICLRGGLAFVNINNEDEDGILLTDKLKFCLHEMTPKKTEFISFICMECCNELKRSYAFAKKCTNSEHLLLGYIKKLTQEKINSKPIECNPQNVPESNDSWERATERSLDELPLKCLLLENYGTTILQPPPKTVTENGNSVDSLLLKKKRYEQKMQRHINAMRRQKTPCAYPVTVKQKPHVCTVCKKRYTTKRYLRQHLAIHYGKSPNKCKICDKVFANNGQLNLHMLRHTGVKNFKCKICDRSFVRKSVLKTHMLTHTTGKQYECGICSMEFRLKASLEKHMYVHSCNKTYKCSICSERFCHKFILDEHFQTHLQRHSYKCTVCGKRFKQKCLVDLHMVAHSTERPYTCSLCGKTFKLKFTLQRHMLIHSGVRGYKCEECHRQFRDQYTLNIHMLTHINT